MARIKLRTDGREFPIVLPIEWTMGEVLDLEAFTGQAMDRWSSSLEQAVVMWHSAELANVPLSWEELRKLRPRDIERLSDPDDPDPDADPLDPDGGRSPRPPEDGDQAGRGSTPTSSSSSPSGSD